MIENWRDQEGKIFKTTRLQIVKCERIESDIIVFHHSSTIFVNVNIFSINKQEHYINKSLS